MPERRGSTDEPGDLIISGGGSTAVASDDLLAAADQLTALSREAIHLGAELQRIDARLSSIMLTAMQAPGVAAVADRDLQQAQIVLAQIEVEARTIGWALVSSAEGYGVVERMLGSSAGALGGTLAGGLGALGPLGGLLTLAAAGGATSALGPEGIRRLVTTPEGVEFVRQAVMASDDAAMAAAGIPAPIAAVLGDRGLGVVGLATTATLAGGIAGMVGLARESPVAIASATRQPLTRPPQGFEERLDRIPVPSENGGAQVRVDVWELPDGTRVAEAYIAGTVTFDPGRTGEPFDMAGNLAAIAGDEGGSVHAVELALAEAGVDSQTPVQVIGYSQGGAVAARLAESGEWNVAGLLSFGGPTGQIAIPDGIPAVLVEHTDDVVPALGGTQDNLEAVIVERQAYEPDEIPEDDPAPAHLRHAYLRTAALMDAAASEAVRGAGAQLDALMADARPVSSTTYEVDRVSASSVPRR